MGFFSAPVVQCTSTIHQYTSIPNIHANIFIPCNLFSGVFVEEYKIYIISKPPCLLHGTPLNNIEKLILPEKEGKSVCTKEENNKLETPLAGF